MSWLSDEYVDWHDEYPPDKRCDKCNEPMSLDLDNKILICDNCKRELPYNGEFVFFAFQRCPPQKAFNGPILIKGVTHE